MDALQLMSNEGLTSVAVVDNAFNVVGNISTADVKLLTTTSSLPLLKNSCIHFVSVILSERGIGDGKDSFPGKSYPFINVRTISSSPRFSISRQPILHSCPHRRQTCCNALSQNVGGRSRLPITVHPSHSSGHTISHARRRITTTTWIWSWIWSRISSVVSRLPRRISICSAWSSNFWPTYRSDLVDRYSEPLCSPIWSQSPESQRQQISPQTKLELINETKH
jgi:hypothetical protein